MKNVIMVLFTLGSLILYSQPSIIWQKTYGGSGVQYLSGGVLPTKSGGYIIAGDSNSGISGNKTTTSLGAWLIGIDNVGNIVWEKGFCKVSGSVLDFKSTYDGNYIICISSSADTCAFKSRKSSLSDVWLLKINENGDVLWEKTISGTNTENDPLIITTQDKGYLLGVESNSDIGLDKTDFLWGNSDYWIIKLDSLGNIEWDRTLGGSKQDGVKALVETPDGYLIGGFSGSGVSGQRTAPSFGSVDYWIIKLNKQGKNRWQKAYGGNSVDYLYDIVPTNDKGFLVCGSSSSADTSGNKTTPKYGQSDIWLIKIDSLGNLVWQQSYGGNNKEGANPIKLVASRGSNFYLFCTSWSGISGNKITPLKGGSDFWILNLDSVGNIINQFSFGGDGEDILRNLYIETDSTLILSGESSSSVSGDKTTPSYGIWDYWVLKVKLDQKITATKNKETPNIQLYPNPTRDIVNFVSDVEIDHAIIINLYGSTFFHKLNGNQFIDVSQLISGAYFIKLIDKKGNCVHGEMITLF